MPLELSNSVKIIGVVVIAVIIFIGAMVGTSLRKLSTEEGNYVQIVLLFPIFHKFAQYKRIKGATFLLLIKLRRLVNSTDSGPTDKHYIAPQAKIDQRSIRDKIV